MCEFSSLHGAWSELHFKLVPLEGSMGRAHRDREQQDVVLAGVAAQL